MVTWNRDQMAEKYPEARILTEFEGGLSNADDRVVLLDRQFNIADEVHYYEGGYWPEFADAGGSSLELLDPDADNSKPTAWAASDETIRSEWQHVDYTAAVVPLIHDPPINFNEFVMGLLDTGEVLIDNLSVQEIQEDGSVELIQNSTFSNDQLGTIPDKWRIQGTHYASEVVQDPDDPANQVLKLSAIARTNYLSNHAETTLADGAEVVNGNTYRISYDAKWLAGSPQLHTELYYKDAARTTILAQPSIAGTPGAQNSHITGDISSANLGPTVHALRHEPVVPNDTQEVTITVMADDPDTVSTVQLLYRLDGQDEFSELAMQTSESGSYSAAIPAQPDESLVQFYVEAVDTAGNRSVYPPKGAESRALYQVNNEFELSTERHTFQSLMMEADADALHDRVNMLDNFHRGVTVVYDGLDVYYDAGARLRGSMFSRQNIASTGYNVAFREDQRFRGVYESIAFDQGGENEIVVKFINLQSGNGGGTYDDVFQLQTPSGRGGGPTLVYLARHGDVFLDEQFGPDAGTLFKFEGIRVLTSTVDGEPESLKLYQPIGWVSTFDIEDLGDDKELYRWPFLINGNRAEDDFSGIIRMAKTFSAPDNQLEAAVAETLDMDTWSRSFALMSLFGIGDAYSQGNPHNLNIYVPRDGEPIQAYPWDWDFVFSQPATAPLHGIKEHWPHLRRSYVRAHAAWSNERFDQYRFQHRLHDALGRTFWGQVGRQL